MNVVMTIVAGLPVKNRAPARRCPPGAISAHPSPRPPVRAIIFKFREHFPVEPTRPNLPNLPCFM